jgi:hypothetical protein
MSSGRFGLSSCLITKLGRAALRDGHVNDVVEATERDWHLGAVWSVLGWFTNGKEIPNKQLRLFT